MNIMTTLFCALFIKMALPDESLVKDVWFAMWEVQAHARREKVLGPCRNLGKLANSCFEQWLTKPDVLRLYAEKVLAAPLTHEKPVSNSSAYTVAMQLTLREPALDLSRFSRKHVANDG